jgi:hypothetical protein
VNLRRRKSKTAAAGVRRVERIQHLGVVVCLPQGVRASPSERIRVGKLRRYRTFEISSKESTGILCRGMFKQELQVQVLEGKF